MKTFKSKETCLLTILSAVSGPKEKAASISCFYTVRADPCWPHLELLHKGEKTSWPILQQHTRTEHLLLCMQLHATFVSPISVHSLKDQYSYIFH